MSDKPIKQYVFRKGAQKKIPVSGTFELTSRCNLNCKMCYIHMSAEEQKRIGCELTKEQWIECGRQAVSQGMIYLLLTGGEPLLRPDFCEIYSELCKMGILITVNTNATLIDEKVIECFKKHVPEKVNITLYGFSEEIYASLCGCAKGFEKAIRGIQMLKDAGIRINLNTTFTKYNISDMEKIVNFAKTEKIPVRMSSYIFPPVRNRHQSDSVNLSPEELGDAAAKFDLLTLEKEQIEKRKALIERCLRNESISEKESFSKVSSCMAGRGAFWITWDGKMYPCGMLPDFTSNVMELGVAKAWEETKKHVPKMLLSKACSICRYQPICPSCVAISSSLNQNAAAVPIQMCRRVKAYINSFTAYSENL